MRVIFLGTPSFAAASLDKIISSRHEVVGVVTQPDRANSRRGNKIIFSPVKVLAEANNIPVFQYENVSKEGEEELKSLDADIMVTAAYGQILRQNILDICRYGIINVHASLLPKYRGSSPVQWAIINGDERIGVTIMKTELGVDTGDMILKDSIVPDGTENSEEMLDKLSVIGGDLAVKALDLIEEGKAEYTKQDESLATHCRMLRKEDGLMDFDRDATDVVNFVRGMNPWPSAYIDTRYGVIKVLRAVLSVGQGKAGEVIAASPKTGLIVACRTGAVELTRIKPDNGKEMDAKSYLAGHKIEVGSNIGE